MYKIRWNGIVFQLRFYPNNGDTYDVMYDAATLDELLKIALIDGSPVEIDAQRGL